MPLRVFHPAVRRWFEETLGRPSPPQERGWPAIRAGKHTLITAPTGSGKTLAAFLCAIDSLVRETPGPGDATRVVYVSPLKALGNDVRKNLQVPLEGIRALDPGVPEVRVLVRSGDTPAAERARMARRPPHVLVTTPESLYILLTSQGGRAMLHTVRSVIVDEIHAVLDSKRGAHLALSLERLEALCGREVQRIGLSATVEPLELAARFLGGVGREVEVVEAGGPRELDLAIELPGSELGAVCAHEVWEEIYARVVELIEAHRTTLVFVNTRKLAERVAARLTERLGREAVTSHHGSLARERRLEAEQRLKRGELKALVATASLELGIDVGDVDLVVQLGVTPAIATFLQRIGRAGHGIGRVPKGRIFPLTIDELVCAAGLLLAVRRGVLDRVALPRAPLDILAQQIVAACVAETWEETELLARLRRAWPYRELSLRDFEDTVALHTRGRHALLHRDGVRGRLRATRRARIPALTGGGAIPDQADYRVESLPEGTTVGSLHEDFAIESNAGDIFQLGNASWRILRVEPGVVQVASAEGLPPTLPFWIAEGPSRTRELSAALAEIREHPERLDDLPGVGAEVRRQIRAYLDAARAALGALPTQRRLVVERFFDLTGGMQVVMHCPFGSRINRAFGLALRKRFCRRFGFELQAAANEEAFLLSLGRKQSFPLAEIASYLNAETARDVLTQALLASPMFQTRWRWNVTRALVVPRTRGGRRVPAPLLRFRADDALADAFPDAVACGENLPAGDLRVPLEHPLVRQTVEDCLHEAMDLEGLLEILRGLRDGSIELVAVDRPEPSPLAEGILNAQPYAFLDDAPLEERRTQAVLSRRALTPETVFALGELDPEVVARVRKDAWPQPRDPEELHEVLGWIGYLTAEEAAAWPRWIEELARQGRAVFENGRWFATEAGRDPVELWRGRLEALGPVHADDPALRALEAEGVAVRVRWLGREAFCHRRLLARIQRETVERLRRDTQPVPPATFLAFLARWQHVDPCDRREGPAGLVAVLDQLEGLDLPAAALERHVLRARVADYDPDWLDRLTLSGEWAWLRLWGDGACPLRAAPITLVRRSDLPAWLALAGRGAAPDLPAEARALHELLAARGAMFAGELREAAGLLPSRFEAALAALLARGLATCDSFDALRQLCVPPGKRRLPLAVAGRFGLLPEPPPPLSEDEAASLLAERMLRRWGVVLRKLLERERAPVPWRALQRTLRRLELEGRVRGGRFVTGFSGEQFALPEAVTALRRRRGEAGDDTASCPVEVVAADPLNLTGILTPEPRVPPRARRRVVVGG